MFYLGGNSSGRICWKEACVVFRIGLIAKKGGGSQQNLIAIVIDIFTRAVAPKQYD